MRSILFIQGGVNSGLSLSAYEISTSVVIGQWACELVIAPTWIEFIDICVFLSQFKSSLFLFLTDISLSAKSTFVVRGNTMICMTKCRQLQAILSLEKGTVERKYCSPYFLVLVYDKIFLSNRRFELYSANLHQEINTYLVEKSIVVCYSPNETKLATFWKLSFHQLKIAIPFRTILA